MKVIYLLLLFYFSGFCAVGGDLLGQGAQEQARFKNLQKDFMDFFANYIESLPDNEDENESRKRLKNVQEKLKDEFQNTPNLKADSDEFAILQLSLLCKWNFIEEYGYLSKVFLKKLLHDYQFLSWEWIVMMYDEPNPIWLFSV